jgi:hypothetical protein
MFLNCGHPLGNRTTPQAAAKRMNVTGRCEVSNRKCSLGNNVLTLAKTKIGLIIPLLGSGNDIYSPISRVLGRKDTTLPQQGSPFHLNHKGSGAGRVGRGGWELKGKACV